ncbi:hypothetical protein BST61_g10519 [Cercospora zeina]
MADSWTSLRRRIFGTSGDSTPAESRDPSPAPAPHEALKRPGAYRVLTNEKFDELKAAVKSSKGKKRRNAWVFGLGLLGGLSVAGFFASKDGALDQLVSMAGLEDMNLDSLMDVLPTGLIRDVQDIQVILYSPEKSKLLTTTPSLSVSMRATRAFVPNTP